LNSKTMRERLLASSMICGAAILAFSATSASAQEANTEVQEIVVTGSRIPQPNMRSVSPIQVVGSQEISLGGRPATIDILNQLPQFSQNSGSTGGSYSSTSNPLKGPGGVSTADLRGLGVQRTLVLIDGRRLGIGDPNTGNTNPAPDLNQIPSQLIDRVEVLTGGASAVYGSDAIAGVVNFVMKRHFEGVQMDAQWGVYQHSNHNENMQAILPARQVPVPQKNHWDGKSRDLSIVWGANAPDGKGNVTAYFTYHDQDPVTQLTRDYSACQLVQTAGVPACGGSPNSNFFQIGQTPYAVVGNTFAPWNANAITTPPPFFNSNAYAYLLQQSTRYTAGYFANYEVNKHFNLYSEFGFMQDRTNVTIAPTGLFQGSGSSQSQVGGFLVNCNNPFLSAQQQGAIGCTPAQISSGANKDLLIGRRNIEGGGRNTFYEHQNYRVVFGSKGELFDSWKYDLGGSFYRTEFNEAKEHYLAISRIQNALLVTQGPNGPVCISGGSCVPYNIFRDGGVTDAALKYLDITGTSRGTITERIIEGTVTGDLGDYGIKSPMAEDGVGVAFGFHQRRDHLQYLPDAAEEGGDLSGAGGASVRVNNSLRVAEAYAEGRVPLVQDKPFFDDLTAELGFRYSDYSTGIQAKTWKIGLQWAPTPDIRFRGSYNKAIRAPSIIELYSPQTVTNTSQVADDPCAVRAANSPPAATLQQCLLTGLTAAQYLNITNCPSGQCATLQGGNPALSPETAKTFTVGFTTTPRFIRGFTASVDYYRINLKDVIGSIPLGVIVQRCLQTGNPDFCSQIVRGPSGILFGTTVAGAGYINGANVNIGAKKFSGIDFQAAYALPLEDWGVDSIGGISVNFTATYLMKTSTTPLPGDPTYECVGLYGTQCETLNPRWRQSLRVNWTTPWDLTLSATWRYIGGVKLETDTNEPTIGRGTVDPFNHTLPQRSYLDLAALWHVSDRFSVRAGLNNAFDQDPPLVQNRLSGTGSPNTYPTYDLLGRHFFMALTANF